MNKGWYNSERVGQPGSVILNAWLAERQAAKIQASASAGSAASEITRDSALFDVMTGGYGMAGAGVPITEKTSLAIGAVHACVSLIGGALAAVPFHLYKKKHGMRERYDDDLWYLFNESPSPAWTAASAWAHAALSIGLHGDAFWHIRRANDYSNGVIGFAPLHPQNVNVYRKDGENRYQFIDNGIVYDKSQVDVLHFPGLGFDGKRSLSPVRHALRPAAGIALAADEYAGSFFRNGQRADFALVTPKELKEDAAQVLRTTWATRHSGANNAHLPAVLTGGLDVRQLSMTSEDAQLLATRQFQVQDIARIFGVPPHMIGYTEKSTSWGQGIEQMSIGFVRYTLRRYIDSITQEINRKIWPRSRLFFGEFNVDALMDGDSVAQSGYFSKALGGPGAQGWMTINEVRRLKNLPPIDDGDKLIFAGVSASPTF